MKVLALLLLAAVASANPTDRNGRIVNGEVAAPHQFPYQVRSFELWFISEFWTLNFQLRSHSWQLSEQLEQDFVERQFLAALQFSPQLIVLMPEQQCLLSFSEQSIVFSLSRTSKEDQLPQVVGLDIHNTTQTRSLTTLLSFASQQNQSHWTPLFNQLSWLLVQRPSLARKCLSVVLDDSPTARNKPVMSWGSPSRTSFQTLLAVFVSLS